MDAITTTYIDMQRRLLARADNTHLQSIARAVLLAADVDTAGLLLEHHQHQMLPAHVPLLQALVGTQVPEIA